MSPHDTVSERFLDSSALIKRYVSEVGSDWVQRLCEVATISISGVFIVELSAALARRTREGTMSPLERDATFAQFLEDARLYVTIDIDARLLDAAGSLAFQSPPAVALRALDAIQLASAQAFAASVEARGLGPVMFVSADTRLLAAAEWAGLATDNPNDHP